MRFPFTEEMRRLEQIYEPYEEGCHLKDDAPQEAIEAKKEFDRLFRLEFEKNSRLDLL